MNEFALIVIQNGCYAPVNTSLKILVKEFRHTANDSCILGLYTMQQALFVSMFWRNLLHPSSGRLIWSRQLQKWSYVIKYIGCIEHFEGIWPITATKEARMGRGGGVERTGLSWASGYWAFLQTILHNQHLFFPPHHFSIHLYRLKHPAEGSSRFLQNRSTLHGVGVQKMTSNLKSTIIITIKSIFWTSFTVEDPVLLRHDAGSLRQWFPTFWRRGVGSVEMSHRLGCGVIWAGFTALM